MKLMSQNLPDLDEFKGLGILLIMAFTCFWFPYSLELIQPASVGTFSYWFQGFLGAGWIGIDLFMVVAGFVTSDELLKNSNLRPFYGHRWWRLGPLYFGFLIAFYIFAAWQQPILLQTGDWLSHLSLWTLTDNLLIAAEGDRAQFPSYVQHLWTIAVGAQFFLLWPLVIRFLGQKPALWFCIGIIVALPVVRHFLLQDDESMRLTVTVLTPLRLDSFAWGALLSLAGDRYSGHKILPLVSIFSFLALVAFFVWRPGFNQSDPLVLTFGYSLLGIFFSSSLSLLLPLRAGELRHNLLTMILNFPLLSSLGRYSYGLYLIHQPMIQILVLWAFLPGPGWTPFLVFSGLCIGMSLLVSMITFHTLERRFFV